MAITIQVKTNVDQVLGRLRGNAREQIPYATARALTMTAREVATAETAALSEHLDRPTPFTQRAIGTASASKGNLAARVFVKDIQAAYLSLQVTGGIRLPKRRALVLPGSGQRVNQYGNLPRNKLRELLARRGIPFVRG